MCTGIRIVRDLFATPRCTAWRIHQVAYVENLKPRRQSNFSTARMRPMIPSWIRSSSESPWPWYFFAIDTTRRRFELTIWSFAALSPVSIALRELDLFDGGEQRVAAGLVEEELERVARHRGDLLVPVRRLLELGDGAVVGEVDPLLLELLVEGRDVLVVQLELLDEPDERGQVDAAQLLAVLHQHPQLLRAHALPLPGWAAS